MCSWPKVSRTLCSNHFVIKLVFIKVQEATATEAEGTSITCKIEMLAHTCLQTWFLLRVQAAQKETAAP